MSDRRASLVRRMLFILPGSNPTVIRKIRCMEAGAFFMKKLHQLLRKEFLIAVPSSHLRNCWGMFHLYGPQIRWRSCQLLLPMFRDRLPLIHGLRSSDRVCSGYDLSMIGISTLLSQPDINSDISLYREANQRAELPRSATKNFARNIKFRNKCVREMVKPDVG